MLSSLFLLSFFSASLISGVQTQDANSLSVTRSAETMTQPTLTKLEIYRREADRDPGSAKSLEATRKLALEYLKACRRTEAIATCSRMLCTFPLSNALGRAAISIAHTAMEAGDYDTARTISNMIITKWPKGDISVRARKELILMDIAVGDDATIEKSLSEFCKAHEDRSDSVVESAFLNIGRACIEHRGEARAQSFCRQALAKWPNSTRVRMTFEPVEILLATDSDREARLSRLLQDRSVPSLAVVAAVAGKYAEQGKNDKASVLCDRLLNASPGSEAAVKAISLKAKIDIAGGKTSAGVTALTQLKTQYGVSPSLSTAVLTVADGYRAAHKDAEAKAVYEYAKQKWPSGRVGIRTTARHAVVSGQTASEVESQVGACLVAPDPNGKMFGQLFLAGVDMQEDARRKFAEGDVIQGKTLLDKSMAVWKALYRKSPTSQKGICSLALGECYMNQGMYGEAVAQYEKSLHDNPMGQNACMAQFMVGECYRMLKDKGAIDEAEGESKMMTAYRKVLRNYPGGPMTRGAMARLGVDAEVGKGGAK